MLLNESKICEILEETEFDVNEDNVAVLSEAIESLDEGIFKAIANHFADRREFKDKTNAQVAKEIKKNKGAISKDRVAEIKDANRMKIKAARAAANAKMKEDRSRSKEAMIRAKAINANGIKQNKLLLKADNYHDKKVNPAAENRTAANKNLQAIRSNIKTNGGVYKAPEETKDNSAQTVSQPKQA